MITILFIILKVTNSLIISWWWIILAVLVDAELFRTFDKLKERISELEDELESLNENSEDDPEEGY